MENTIGNDQCFNALIYKPKTDGVYLVALETGKYYSKFHQGDWYFTSENYGEAKNSRDKSSGMYIKSEKPKFYASPTNVTLIKQPEEKQWFDALIYEPTVTDVYSVKIVKSDFYSKFIDGQWFTSQPTIKAAEKETTKSESMYYCKEEPVFFAFPSKVKLINKEKENMTETTTENQPEKHVHYDLIMKWAANPKLVFEYFNTDTNKWRSLTNPSWFADKEYRIKPEPKPDVVRYSRLTKGGTYDTSSVYNPESDNIKHTYDGETGELKSVEIIK